MTAAEPATVRPSRATRRRARARVAGFLLGTAAAFLLSACGAGKLPLEQVDPLAAPLHPTYEQAFSILQRTCAPCHRGGGAPQAALRRGIGPFAAEEDSGGADYATCKGIHAGLGGLRRTALDGGSMPPGAWPRFTEREKLVLRRWLADGACSPCFPCP
ncbi:MAG: hypothetical protein HZC42_07020 [Candidatus Eisenbacteria bacterium]|nr:hypothetical protein [Candidatus Eisenbacteria bacterium]